MRQRRLPIAKREIRECKYCGGSIYWLQWSKGGFFPADVHYETSLGHYVITGAGNNYNLKTKHDCRGHARLQADSLRRTVADYQAKVDAAREGLRQQAIWEAAGNTVEDPAARGMCERITADWKVTVAVFPAHIEKLEAEIAQHEELANKK